MKTSKTWDPKFIRHTTIRRVLTLRNPGGAPQDLRGCSFVFHVSPNVGSNNNFTIDSSGTDPKLIYDNTSLQNGQIILFISDSKLDSYEWRKAEYWLQMIDVVGDSRRRMYGTFEIVNPNA